MSRPPLAGKSSVAAVLRSGLCGLRCVVMSQGCPDRGARVAGGQVVLYDGAMAHTWPLDLRYGTVRVRSLRARDRRSFDALRRRNQQWLTPWNATTPMDDADRDSRDGLIPFYRLRRAINEQGRAGWALHLVVEYEGRLAGQVAASPLLFGSFSTATVGYWIDEKLAGAGIAPLATALVMDHCHSELGIHRFEANIRPDNHASRRVVEKLHFRHEGVRRRFIHVDGEYRDHECYGLTVEEIPALTSYQPVTTRYVREYLPQFPSHR